MNGEDGRASVEIETVKPVLLTAPPQTDSPGYSKSRFSKFLRGHKSSSVSSWCFGVRDRALGVIRDFHRFGMIK